MNLTVKLLLGAAAATATGAAALLGTGAVGAAERAGTAEGVAARGATGAYCDRVERGVWRSAGASRNMTGHRCSLPSDKRRWLTVRTDELVLTHYRTEYEDGGVDRTETLHDRIIRCLGYTTGGKGTVNWFGCPP
ncbi:hypothetical protein ABZ920_29665 [Streptomyces sp. NPDC046831]|uniref:hypothetical protein n=1 Tax=Streptomyces sp. NPDC046831 TaxID=3154805 RepID=UPI0033BFEC21